MSNEITTEQITISNDLALKISERVLLNLHNQHLGALMNKGLNITPEAQRTGTLRIIKYKKLQLQNEYDGVNIPVQKPGSLTEAISPKGYLSAAYEWESLDTGLSVEGLVSAISSSLATSIAFKYDIMLLDEACKATEQVVDVGELTALEGNASKGAFLKIADAKVDLEMKVNNFYLGLDKMDLHLILNPKLTNRLGVEVANREKLSTDPINQNTKYYEGIDSFVTHSVYLNQKIDKDADGVGIVTETTGSNLEKVYGFIVHREALLVRACLPSIEVVKNQANGNQRVIFKSRYWKETIRPGLVTAIVNGLDANAVKAKGEFTLTTTTTKKINK